MASTHAKAVRRAEVLQRLSSRLGIEAADLQANAKGDAEMALIMTLERVADAVDAMGPQGSSSGQAAKAKAEGPASKDEAAQRVEDELEAETGKDFQQTSDNPPTLAESDKPAPGEKPAKGKGAGTERVNWNS